MWGDQPLSALLRQCLRHRHWSLWKHSAAALLRPVVDRSQLRQVRVHLSTKRDRSTKIFFVCIPPSYAAGKTISHPPEVRSIDVRSRTRIHRGRMLTVIKMEWTAARIQALEEPKSGNPGAVPAIQPQGLLLVPLFQVCWLAQLHSIEQLCC